MATKTTQKTTKKKSWPIVGTIRKNDKGSYIKFADNVVILVDGEEVEMNASRTAMLQSPKDELEGLISRGFVKEDEIDARREKVEEISEWLKYNIVLTPPKKD